MFSLRFYRIVWRVVDILCAVTLFSLVIYFTYVVQFHNHDTSGPARDLFLQVLQFSTVPVVFSIAWFVARISLIFNISEPDEGQRNQILTCLFIFFIVAISAMSYFVTRH